MLPEVFWRHFKSQKNIFVGLEIQFYARKGPFLAFFNQNRQFKAYFASKTHS